MTKIRVLSDLHIEFGPLDLKPIGEDILALAGDVGLHTQGAGWAAAYARWHQIPVVMIAGNHEFYRNREFRSHTVTSTLDALRDLSKTEPLFTFLENDTAIVKGIQFVGSTLWTDFALNGDPVQAAWRAGRAMNDYNLIHVTDRERLIPGHTSAAHMAAREFLSETLSRRRAKGIPVVVLTHHLPSARSIAGRYASSDYNAAYASNLDDLVETSGAALWVHGHTHVGQDYRIGETRVVCNPRGYFGHELNPDFKPDLVIEVGADAL